MHLFRYNMVCLHMDHGKLAASAGLMKASLEIYETSFGRDNQLTMDVESQLLGLLHTIEVSSPFCSQ